MNKDKCYKTTVRKTMYNTDLATFKNYKNFYERWRFINFPKITFTLNILYFILFIPHKKPISFFFSLDFHVTSFRRFYVQM